ncbi:MAG: hypothetical protein WCO18_01305 [bacterium]
MILHLVIGLSSVILAITMFLWILFGPFPSEMILRTRINRLKDWSERNPNKNIEDPECLKLLISIREQRITTNSRYEWSILSRPKVAFEVLRSLCPVPNGRIVVKGNVLYDILTKPDMTKNELEGRWSYLSFVNEQDLLV